MHKIFVKPAREGAIVRHPEKLNYILPAEGEWVVKTNQWQRYLRDGDVVIAQPTIEKSKEEKSSKAEKPAKAGVQ